MAEEQESISYKSNEMSLRVRGTDWNTNSSVLSHLPDE